jgi:hypothetical protein
MYGQRPYVGKNRKEIKHQVLRRQVIIDENDLCDGWSLESADFINKTLKRKDSKRLGFNGGIKDLKNHIWFQNYDWESLYNKTLIAPFIPPNSGNFDKKYCEAVEKLSQETLERYQSYKDKKNFENLFSGYTYINYEITQITSGNESNTRLTTNSKYSKPVISTNPSANYEKKNNRANLLYSPKYQNIPIYNSQKKIRLNDNIIINNIYNNNINIVSNNLLLSNENYVNPKQKNITKKNIKYKIKLGDTSAVNNNNNDRLISNLGSSSSSIFNMNNNNNNNNVNLIKNVNGLINHDKNIMRSSSVGKFELDSATLRNNHNNKKTKHLEINTTRINRINNNNINILSNLSNSNKQGSLNNILSTGFLNSLNGDQNKNRINYEDSNNYNLNAHEIKNNNIDNNSNRNLKINLKNSKSNFYLPQLNSGKNFNNKEYDILRNFNNNYKLRNKLSINQFKFKMNHPNKKGLEFSNKLLIVPGNNYYPSLKRSESMGVMNFGPTNRNLKKSNINNKNNY